MNAPNGLLLHRAKWPSRCRLCSGAVNAGDLIAIPANEDTPVPQSGSRSVWIHASCLRGVLDQEDQARKSRATDHYRLRRSRRRHRMSVPASVPLTVPQRGVS